MGNNNSALFGATQFNIQDIAGATLDTPAGASILSDGEANTLSLAQEFGVSVPTMPLASMSAHARAEAFNGIESALKKIMMDTPKGRELLGGALIKPLQDEQLYSSQLRNCFKPYVLGAGQENYIPLDVNVQAYVTNMDGETVEQTPYGLEGVKAPLQKIETKVMFHISDIRKGTFDLVGRAKEKVESEIFKVEDKRIANLFHKVATGGNGLPIITESATNFKAKGLYTIIEAIAELEGQAGKTLNATSLYMNPYWKQVFRKVTNYKDGFQVSFNTADELTKKGIIANFQGLNIVSSAVIPRESIYITSEPETLGGFVESIPLMVIDTVQDASVGFVVLEEIGVVISNPKGFVTIVVDLEN